MEKEGVEIREWDGEDLPNDWKGLAFQKAGAADIKNRKAEALEGGQTLVMFTQIEGDSPLIHSKQLGEGRLIVIPQSLFANFPDSPAMHRALLETPPPH